MNIKTQGRQFLTFLNKRLGKKDRVIIIGFPNTESGAIEVANHLKRHYDLPVYYVISRETDDDPRKLLLPGIHIVDRSSRFDLKYLFLVMTTRYVFFTHGIFLNEFSKKQKAVNLWHGILYKKVGKLIGNRAILADATVGTSELTQEMFSAAFGVPINSVTTTGYPRNDALLKAKKNKIFYLKKLNIESKFEKILIWLPTYRNSVFSEIRKDGKEVGNPVYIENFNFSKFNSILKENNSFCYIKPHPMAPKYSQGEENSNFIFISDEWISDQGISLYQFLGCTDILISDVSSVIIDYLLLDQPIICVSEDLDEYQNTRGFYFQNIREWLPSLSENEEQLFQYLEELLNNKDDHNSIKREKLKNKFFKHTDSKSTGRLMERVIQN